MNLHTSRYNGTIVMKIFVPNDIITLLLALEARSQIATQQFLEYLASTQTEDYSKLILLKTVALSSDPEHAKQWLCDLY
jgi:hypothetical protein